MTFQNAKVICDGASYAMYSAQTAKRGDAAFSMSRGELMAFAENPRKWLAGFEKPDTKSTAWGTLIDTLLLSPDRMSELIALCPATYQDEEGNSKPWNFNAKVCKAWKKEQGDKLIVKTTEYAAARDAVKALEKHKECIYLVANSKTQVFVCAEYADDATGLVIPVRALLDLVPNRKTVDYGKALVDLKTGQSAEYREFEKSVFRNDYDAQAALHRDLYVEATGEDRTDWLFILQENEPPYEVADPIPMLSSDYVNIGREKYRQALARYCQCLATKNWPGYSVGFRDRIGSTVVLDPEPWMLMSVAERATYPDPPWMKDPPKEQPADVPH